MLVRLHPELNMPTPESKAVKALAGMQVRVRWRPKLEDEELHACFAPTHNRPTHCHCREILLMGPSEQFIRAQVHHPVFRISRRRGANDSVHKVLVPPMVDYL